MQHKEKTRSFLHYWLTTGLLLMLLTLISCTTSQFDAEGNENTDLVTDLSPTATATAILPSATPIPSATPTQTAVAIPSPSVIPSPTVTITPSPSATPTANSTPAPTLTPLPTIPPQQRGQVYTELMSSNGGCALPCWWGIELGTTNVDAVKQLYISLGASIFEQEYPDHYAVVEALFVDPQIENGTQVRHSFVAQDDIVVEAEIQVVYDPNYQIKPLLQRLGQPTEGWMWTIPEPYEGILPSRFRLYFPEQGVFVLYATGGEKIDDAVHICFDGPGGVTLYLWNPAIWDPDETKSIVDRANEAGSAFTLEGYPIDEVSNWDIEQFYTFLTDSTHSECLETPSNLWPPP